MEKQNEMSHLLRSLRIIGVHPVVPTEQDVQEAIEIQWGDNLTGKQFRRAKDHVREHFANLYLLEIEVEPKDADVNWCAITQPMKDQPEANWQTPYDERRLDEHDGHWAFFFHFLDRGRPLQTPLGDCELPDVTPIPSHLQGVVYEVPG